MALRCATCGCDYESHDKKHSYVLCTACRRCRGWMLDVDALVESLEKVNALLVRLGALVR